MALGWEHSSRFDSVSKNGVVEGYRTSTTLFPKKRQAVFVVANGENVDTDSLAFDIAAYELAPEPLGLVDHARFVVKEVPEDATRVAVSFRYAKARIMSSVGMPSVMQTTRPSPASAASRTASAANAAGTKMTEVLAPVAFAASDTVLNTGHPSCVVPPLPGVTPPTTSVPYAAACFA